MAKNLRYALGLVKTVVLGVDVAAGSTCRTGLRRWGVMDSGSGTIYRTCRLRANEKFGKKQLEHEKALG